MKKILVADDSALLRKTLCDIIGADTTEYEMSTCRDGEEALQAVIDKKPDMLIVYMYLPKKNGMEIINTLRSKGISCKVVLLGTEAREDRDAASVLSGDRNVIFVARPFHIFGPTQGKFAQELKDAVKKLFDSRTPATPLTGGSAQTISPRVRSTADEKAKAAPDQGTDSTVPVRSQGGGRRLLAIASSTGGPQALHVFVPMLPANIGVPAVIVQHMPKGFTSSLCERIDSEANLRVKEAEDGEELKANVVYMAPGGRHLEIVDKAGKSYARVFDDPPVNSLRPCADVMFKSIAKTGFDRLVCVVLTGMGSDGTEGLKFLKNYKSMRVITQSKETCVVYGMPKAVDLSGLSNVSVPIDKVADAVRKELGV